MKRMRNWPWSLPGQDFGVTPGGKLKNWRPGKAAPADGKPADQIAKISDFHPHNARPMPIQKLPLNDSFGKSCRSTANICMSQMQGNPGHLSELLRNFPLKGRKPPETLRSPGRQ
jgi:hypothetical protein